MRFHVFASLAVWMIGQLGTDVPRPNERDDPNITVQKIGEALRNLVSRLSLNYNGDPIDECS